MRGFPKHIATPQDLKNVKDLYPKETADYLQSLAEGRFIWVDAGPVGGKEVVTESADLKTVPMTDDTGKETMRKLERMEDPTAHFFKLGLKVEPVAVGKVDGQAINP